jgi:hypothetical protein
MPVRRLRNRGPLRLSRRSCGSAAGTYTDAGVALRYCSSGPQEARRAAYSTAPSRARKGRACTSHNTTVVIGRRIGAVFPLARQHRVGGVPGHRFEPDIEVELALFDRSVRQDRFHLWILLPPALAGLAAVAER